MGSNHSNDTAKLNGESRRVNLGSDRSPMAATTVPLKECWKIATAYKYELLDERTTKRRHLWAAFALQWDLTPVSVWWSSGLGRGSRSARHNQQDPRRRPWVTYVQEVKTWLFISASSWKAPDLSKIWKVVWPEGEMRSRTLYTETWVLIVNDQCFLLWRENMHLNLSMRSPKTRRDKKLATPLPPEIFFRPTSRLSGNT